MPDTMSAATLASPSDVVRALGTDDTPAVLVDRQGCHMAVNGAFATLLGLSGMALIGRRLDEFTPDGGALIARGLRYLDAGIAVPEHEVVVAGRHYLGAIAPVRDEHRRVVAGLVRLRAVSRQAVLARRREPPFGRLREDKWLDSLTGLPNARCCVARLTRELMLLARANDAVSLVLVELDGFGGYVAPADGVTREDCLRLVAETAAGVAHRPGDLVCRVSEARFGTLLPHTDAVGAMRVAERIRLAVRGLNIVTMHIPGAAALTVSAGVITAHTRPVRARHACEAMWRQADQALARAQARGTDQSEAYTL